MTRSDRNTFLSQVSLPFNDKDRVVPYDDYLRVLVPTLEQSPTVREWQMGFNRFTGAGAAMQFSIEPVPVGFVDTYTQIVFRNLGPGGAVIIPTMIIIHDGDTLDVITQPSKWSVGIGEEIDLLAGVSNASLTDDLYLYGRNLVVEPGAEVRINSGGVAVAVAQIITLTFVRYREPGPVIRQTESVDAEIVTS